MPTARYDGRLNGAGLVRLMMASYWGQSVNFAIQRGVSRMWAEDVVADAALAVLAAKGDEQMDNPIGYWFTALRSHILDFCKLAGRRQRLAPTASLNLLAEAGFEPPNHSAETSPEAKAESRSELAQVLATIASLSPYLREALVCKMRGVEPTNNNQYRVSLSRARKILRSRLSGES